MTNPIPPAPGGTLGSALRVGNEAFLVASTIERCPKTMMLRELVMNALEAAAAAPPGARRVEIGTASIAGTPKLCLWNTGPGMTGEELHRITNLAASLHKQNTLDANFGMGAKVASLPSNRHGLRFRSCRAGVVSQVMLGQRDGVYGRLLDEAGQEVSDVTALVTARGRYDLATDWTEIVLLGNRAEQNTVTDPYDGNPAMPPGWVEAALTQRFYRLPEGTTVTLAAELVGGPARRFRPLGERTAELARAQSVAAPGGLHIHYGYDPAQRSTAAGLRAIGGTAGIVYRDEIYALREGAAWIAETPNFAIPFAARHCAVFVELPDDFGVRPEAYRQFLRFRDGDQRQVMLGDFAAAVRAAMPGWLREVIASYGPATVDYAGELRGELAALVEQLGIPARSRAAAAPRGAALPREPAAPRPPRPPRLEPPPELISLRDESLIDERGLAARAARYYPDAHQLFVNLRYPSMTTMAMQLGRVFESVADPQRTEPLATEVAEWAITRKLARAVVYTLAKRHAGWSAEDVARAQSPESLSVIADDTALLLPAARRRLAELLGVAEPALPDAPLTPAQRLRGELAQAEQAARRALGDPAARVAPILRRISDIQLRQRDPAAALNAAERAVAADPADPWSHHQVSLVLQQMGDLDGAEQAGRRALALAAAPGRFLRHLAGLARQRGQVAEALALLHQAIDADPDDARAHSELGWVHQQAGDLAAAEAAARRAFERSAGHKVPYLCQLSGLARARGDMGAALDLAHAAVADDPEDPAAHSHLAAMLQQAGALDEAADAARQAVNLEAWRPARYLRQLSGIARAQDNLPAALSLAEQAVAADPDDVWSHSHLAGVLLQAGDLDAAEEALHTAIGLGGANPAGFLRQLSQIAARRRDLPEAVALARQAVAAAPTDPWTHKALSALLLQQGDADAAEHAARQALAVATGSTTSFLLQLAAIERQRGRLIEATEWAERAVAADPDDAACHAELAALLIQREELDAAEAVARRALARNLDGASRVLRQLGEVALRRRDIQGAIGFAQQAVAADPGNIGGYEHLIGLLIRAGELDRARRTAELALSVPAGDLGPIRRRLEELAATAA